jgi:hypothetical protein
VNCGVELKYQATYSLEASGASDYCSLSIRIGVKQVNTLLNGDNISGRFTPEPEGYEIVPLAPGPNTLLLSVEGTTASGRTVTDPHSLVFRVE